MPTNMPILRLNFIGWLLPVLVMGCQQPRKTPTGGFPVDRELVSEIVMRSEFAANLRAICLPGGRLSGTPNAEAAERFVTEKLRNYGLQNIHFEPFAMECWSALETQVTWLDNPPRLLTGAIALSRTLSTPAESITAELVDVGEGKEADFQAQADDLPGNFAFVQAIEAARGNRIQLALSHKAAGVVIMARADRSPNMSNGHATPRPEPIVVIPYNQNLLDRLRQGDKPRLNIRLRTESWIGHPRNVVGEIPGSGPLAHEIVLVGAHLDSWNISEGAIDNASSSTVLLEAARAMGKADWQPRRTVRFVWFSGEEQGLKGSRAYVATHQAELKNIICMINADMVGSAHQLCAYLDAGLLPLVKRVAADLAGYELIPNLATTFRMGDSDEGPFLDQGVAAVRMFGHVPNMMQYYHTADDDYDAVDRRGTLGSAVVLAILVRHLADAPSWLRLTTSQPAM